MKDLQKKQTEEKTHYKIFPKRKTTFQQTQTRINSRLKKVNLSRLEESGKRVLI